MGGLLRGGGGGGGGGGKGYVGPPLKLFGGPGPPLPTPMIEQVQFVHSSYSFHKSFII